MAGEWDGYRIGYTTLLEIILTVVDPFLSFSIRFWAFNKLSIWWLNRFDRWDVTGTLPFNVQHMHEVCVFGPAMQQQTYTPVQTKALLWMLVTGM